MPETTTPTKPTGTSRSMRRGALVGGVLGSVGIICPIILMWFGGEAMRKEGNLLGRAIESSVNALVGRPGSDAPIIAVFYMFFALVLFIAVGTVLGAFVGALLESIKGGELDVAIRRGELTIPIVVGTGLAVLRRFLLPGPELLVIMFLAYGAVGFFIGKGKRNFRHWQRATGALVIPDVIVTSMRWLMIRIEQAQVFYDGDPANPPFSLVALPIIVAMLSAFLGAYLGQRLWRSRQSAAEHGV